MYQEKFDIRWHTYSDHLKDMLHNMMSSNELTDVTLVSEDKKHFKAHRVVLSASSSVFKSIISDNILSSPIIYLRGIQSFEIDSILQFIYLGEATIYQERMNEFLSTAKSLEIKEIGKDFEIHGNVADSEVDIKQEFSQTNNLPAPRLSSEEAKVNVLYKQQPFIANGDRKYPCNQCNYKASKVSHIQEHIKSIHEGARYPCNHCTYKATTQSNLIRHIRSYHQSK